MRNFTEQDVKEKFNERNCCYLSGLPIDLENGSTYELDHILPTKRDGENTLENLEFINPDVNSMKGKRTNEEFLRLVFLIADYCKNQKPKVIWSGAWESNPPVLLGRQMPESARPAPQ